MGVLPFSSFSRRSCVFRGDRLPSLSSRSLKSFLVPPVSLRYSVLFSLSYYGVFPHRFTVVPLWVFTECLLWIFSFVSVGVRYRVFVLRSFLRFLFSSVLRRYFSFFFLLVSLECASSAFLVPFRSWRSFGAPSLTESLTVFLLGSSFLSSYRIPLTVSLETPFTPLLLRGSLFLLLRSYGRVRYSSYPPSLALLRSFLMELGVSSSTLLFPYSSLPLRTSSSSIPPTVGTVFFLTHLRCLWRPSYVTRRIRTSLRTPLYGTSDTVFASYLVLFGSS
jgi:hypothetical protein